MAESLVMTGEDRFIFSHHFAELLLDQMEAALQGEDVSFICRKCKDKNNKNVQWPDVSANDYLYRLAILNPLCFAKQISKYSKAYKQVRMQHKKNKKMSTNNSIGT